MERLLVMAALWMITADNDVGAWWRNVNDGEKTIFRLTFLKEKQCKPCFFILFSNLYV
jgi:hypothetical protein